LKLRPLELDDMEQIRSWRNACLDTLRTPFALTKEQQEDWYKAEVCNRSSRSRFWAIEDKYKQLIGYGGIENIQWENAIGEISLLISPKLHGKGHGTLAARLILDKAFKVLNLHTVYAECYTNNPAIAFWHKIFAKGYKTALPNRKYYNGKYYDAIYYSLDRCNV